MLHKSMLYTGMLNTYIHIQCQKENLCIPGGSVQNHAGCRACSCPHKAMPAASMPLSLQWSYGFYLIHLQGKQGFQFFCKTEDMKRKWMEQFEMAM